MKILQISPLEERVPPHKYGGTELVIANLCNGLVEKGHEVYLAGTGSDQTKANLIPVVPKTLREIYGLETLDKWRFYIYISYVTDILEIINDIKPDIIHSHFEWMLLQFSEQIKFPMVNTLHRPLQHMFPGVHTYQRYKDANYVSISNNQRLQLPDLNWVKTIYHGIDTSAFSLGSRSERDYFAFIGRTSPEKGLAEVCRVIKKTDYKLKIAAKIETSFLDYFKTEVEPLIDGEQIEFLGEVDHAGKHELLKHAKAMLMWLNWEEPFGLTVIESMACGTPVIVNPRGSMPEIITPGKTGFLVNSVAEMQAKLAEADKFDHAEIRKYAQEKFSLAAMTQNYLDLFAKLV